MTIELTLTLIHIYALDKFWEGLPSTNEKGLQLSIQLLTTAPIDFCLNSTPCLGETLSREVLEDDGDHHLILTFLYSPLSHDQRLAFFCTMTNALLRQQLRDDYNFSRIWTVQALKMPSVLQGLRKKNIWRRLLEEDLLSEVDLYPEPEFFVGIMFFLTVAYIFYRDDPELGPKIDIVPEYMLMPYATGLGRDRRPSRRFIDVHDIEMMFACFATLKVVDFLDLDGVWLVSGIMRGDKDFGVATPLIQELLRELLFRTDSQLLHVEFLMTFLEDPEEDWMQVARALYLSTYVVPVTLCALQITRSSETGAVAVAP